MNQDLGNFLRIPVHLLLVALGILLATGSDRTAACFAIGGVILGFTWSWAAIGMVIVLYGVLLSVVKIAEAFT